MITAENLYLYPRQITVTNKPLELGMWNFVCDQIIEVQFLYDFLYDNN
jgi:hypothetical protein